MPGVFVSHASADGEYVEQFVSNVLQLGCDLDLENGDLFYTSGADTGVPPGADLMSYVRKQVGAANLVVALITPTYLTRPICMAELGAAWGMVGDDKLFPLLAPGMKRGDLDGILPSLLIRFSNERDALDQLHERVGNAVGHHSGTPTWGRHVRKWERAVDDLAATLPAPQVASVADLEKLEEKVTQSDQVIDDMERQIAELEQQLSAVSSLKDPVDVARAILPTDHRNRFDALVAQAYKALQRLRPIVREAVRWDVLGSEMPWPDAFEDQGTHRDAKKAYDDGELLGGSADDTLVPDYGFAKVSAARDALQELMTFLRKAAEPELFEVFQAEYGMPLDLKKRQVWDTLLTS
ncbi:toll/interleukin-1 receptor domain-containing protein [Blastococcus sp. TF02A-30]|uniref:toll/interleukin-1 receptor domain-containing protein n=1 Tax=Blastococcus sp. TF02A-30 TaxID=2250580 RepID=UPI0011BF8887|nr:toll/interleukin-1 receptor domain-containing protein [Blastococcus sp. TF02A-30]